MYDHFCQPRVVPDDRHLALNKLVEVATLRWESKEMSPESLDKQQWETSASWWASNQRSRATTTKYS